MEVKIDLEFAVSYLPKFTAINSTGDFFPLAVKTGSGGLMCDGLYDRHIAGVEVDIPNQTAVEHRLLTAATEFDLSTSEFIISSTTFHLLLSTTNFFVFRMGCWD